MPEGIVYKPKLGDKDSAEAPRKDKLGTGETLPGLPVAATGEGGKQAVNPLERFASGPATLPDTFSDTAPGATTPSPSGGVPMSGTIGDLAAAAKRFIGVPYKWGGMSPLGVDCSGFTTLVYKQFGINLPRVSNQQARYGKRISMNQLRPGDMVAWDNSSRNVGADHIEIYLGNGMVIGAARPGTTVRIRKLSANDYKTAWGVQMNIGGGGPAPARDTPRSSGPSAPGMNRTSVNSVDAYLKALRAVESNNNYRAINKSSRASGAYQYIRSTWNNYGGYAEAWQAPASVQDRRARQDALKMFGKYGNWEQVAAHHLYPVWANRRDMWGRSPGVPGTNPSVAEYVRRVMSRM